MPGEKRGILGFFFYWAWRVTGKDQKGKKEERGGEKRWREKKSRQALTTAMLGRETNKGVR